MKINTKSSIRRHSPVIHGGKIPSKNSDQKIIDFSSNITPLGIELDPDTGVDLSNTEEKKN